MMILGSAPVSDLAIHSNLDQHYGRRTAGKKNNDDSKLNISIRYSYIF
jgi:hypothetical protein